MRVFVAYGPHRLDLDLPDAQHLGSWHAPAALSRADLIARTRHALENPLGYPPLRQAVVPGDQVVIPVEPGIPELTTILRELIGVLQNAGVEASDITILPTLPPATPLELPGVARVENPHPDDPASYAYLAATKGGRRVYLNRLLTDADVVVPIGTLGFDPALGLHGPWAVIDPALGRAEEAAKADAPRPASARLDESVEISWLLGAQLQVAVEIGEGGVAGIQAGEIDALRAAAQRSVPAAWTIHAPRRPAAALAGIGGIAQPATLDDLAQALKMLTRVCGIDAPIVVLSDIATEPGPALRHLAASEDPRQGPTLLRGREGDPDYPTARRIAQALTRARIYLLSRLEPDLVESLGMIPLEGPDQAAHLLARAEDVLVVSPAERFHAHLDEAGA